MIVIISMLVRISPHNVEVQIYYTEGQATIYFTRLYKPPVDGVLYPFEPESIISSDIYWKAQVGEVTARDRV